MAKDLGKRVQSAVEMDILGNYNGRQVIIYIYIRIKIIPRATSIATKGTSIWSSTSLYTSTI